MPYPQGKNSATEALLEPNGETKSKGMSNQSVLAVTTASFAIFVIAEIIGALVNLKYPLLLLLNSLIFCGATGQQFVGPVGRCSGNECGCVHCKTWRQIFIYLLFY